MKMFAGSECCVGRKQRKRQQYWSHLADFREKKAQTADPQGRKHSLLQRHTHICMHGHRSLKAGIKLAGCSNGTVLMDLLPYSLQCFLE